METAQSMEAQAQALKTPVATYLAMGAVTSESTPQPEMPVSFTISPTTKSCYRCGRTGHLSHACLSRELVCHRCKKRGHLARVCRGGGRSVRARGGARRRTCTYLISSACICYPDEIPGGYNVIRSVHSVGVSNSDSEK